MPISCKVDKERKLVLSTGSGFVTRQEVLAHQDEILNDPDFDPSFSQLSDFAELKNCDIGMEDLRTFAQRDVFSFHSRRAIIVKGDIAYGFAKIFDLYRQMAGAQGIRIFREADEALGWILEHKEVSIPRTMEASAGSASR